ncbi:MAG: hypothetical protein V7K32_12235 [Nostoc sp.]|uniref:hypothetical protein n=1 Tax=Nostoc sp. TaxID=1180 RepID=UPI002FF76987
MAEVCLTLTTGFTLCCTSENPKIQIPDSFKKVGNFLEQKSQVRSQTVSMRIAWRGQHQFSLITAVTQPGIGITKSFKM